MASSSSADSKSFFDWIIIVTPIVISMAVAWIGYLQYRTNRYKLKLDLYNRRFAVYEKALELFQAYYSEDKANLTTSKEKFIRFYRESIFLFGEDSDVYKRLTELKDTLYFLIDFKEKYSIEPHKENEYEAMLKVKESKRDPQAMMEELERALMIWIDFKKIEK